MIGKTMLFNPFTGSPRHPDDIRSDPSGLLVWDGEEPLRAALAEPPSGAYLPLPEPFMRLYGQEERIAWGRQMHTYARKYAEQCVIVATAECSAHWQKKMDADRAQRAPLTDEQITVDGLMMTPNRTLENCADAFVAGVRYAERAHGIGGNHE